MPVGSQRFDSRQSMKDKRFEVFHYRDKKLDNVGIHHHDGTAADGIPQKVTAIQDSDRL